MLIAGWLLFALAAFFGLPGLLYFPGRQLRRFADRVPEPLDWPSLSVIVAAKDEAASVEAALRGLLSSDYPRLEIVFVNDRSTDRTGEIADRVAQTDARLSVVHLTALPSGWLGKCHAMSQAAQRATGDYLLFTDGDVLFEPDAIRLAMRYVVARKLAHFCLLPSMITSSYWERTIVAMFGMMFLFGMLPWLRKVRAPQSYFGIGAFNLVSRDAYEAVGGHHPIRLDVCDDMKLGKLLYRHGYSADFLLAGSAVRVRWQDSAWGVICGLEKNAFAALNYSIWQLLWVTLLLLAWHVVPYASCPWWSEPAGSGFLATFVLLHVVFARLALPTGAGISIVPAYLFGALAVLFAFWRSAFKTLRRGGVAWRETVYPLDELRKHLFR